MALCVYVFVCVFMRAYMHSVYKEQSEYRPKINFISRTAKELANTNGDSFVASSHYGEVCRELRS